MDTLECTQQTNVTAVEAGTTANSATSEGAWARFRAAYRERPLLRSLLKAGMGLFAVVVAVFSMKSIQIGAIFGTILTVSPWAFALAIVTALIQSALLATRFWGIFPKKKRPSWGLAARAFAYSQSANVYLPGRAGEVLRVVTLTRAPKGEDAEAAPAEKKPTSVADATSATILDRVLDIVAFIVMALVFGKTFLAGAVVAALSWGWVLLAAAGVLAVVTLLVRRFAPNFFSKARGHVRDARRAARELISARRFVGGVSLGLLSWVAELGTMLLLAWGLGLHITAMQMIISLIVLNLGIAIPVTFANIGAYEAATVIGLAPFGVSMTDALALGTLHHILQLLAVFGPALFFWVRDRFARRRARRLALPKVPALPALANDATQPALTI